jgi:hypothetical protein
MLDAGATPAGIMSASEIEATVNKAAEYLGVGTDESDAIIGCIIAFAALNTASDRVLTDPSVDQQVLFALSTGDIFVDTVPFFTAVFGLGVSRNALRQFVRAFPERSMAEMRFNESEMAKKFGIADIVMARGDILPKNFVEMDKYSASAYKADKAERVTRGVEHTTLHRNGGVTYDTGNNF